MGGRRRSGREEKWEEEEKWEGGEVGGRRSGREEKWGGGGEVGGRRSGREEKWEGGEVGGRSGREEKWEEEEKWEGGEVGGRRSGRRRRSGREEKWEEDKKWEGGEVGGRSGREEKRLEARWLTLMSVLLTWVSSNAKDVTPLQPTMHFLKVLFGGPASEHAQVAVRHLRYMGQSATLPPPTHLASAMTWSFTFSPRRS